MQFSVTDTGIGVPAEKHRLIFKSFEQADQSTTRVCGGTGLGLAIVEKLVTVMGGNIWVESEVGQGSIFHFTAQFGLQDPSMRRALSPPSEWQGLGVLVVDDDVTQLEILHETLRIWGLQPTVVDNGWAALAALKKASHDGRPFGLALLDVRMPSMDGFAVAEQIRTDHRTSACPLVMMSCASLPDDDRCKSLPGSASRSSKPSFSTAWPRC